MYNNPTYDSIPIFGIAVTIKHIPAPGSYQNDEFIGTNGVLSLFCGGRGRRLEVTGCLIDVDLDSLNNDEALLLSYVDGIARTLIDDQGRSWDNVVFTGEYNPGPTHPTPAGWVRPYTAMFRGLS